MILSFKSFTVLRSQAECAYQSFVSFTRQQLNLQKEAQSSLR